MYGDLHACAYLRLPEFDQGVTMKPANQPASDQPAMHRRKLLGAAGTTGALAAAATLLATRNDDSTALAEDQAKAAPQQGGGYRVTDHVLRYYQTAKV